ncbi:hypothetical protein KI387_023222, partial [Taxus chinensis]
MALCTAAAASKARLYTPLHSVLVPSIPFPASRGRLYGTPTRPPAHKTTGIMHVAHRPMKQPLRVTSEESSNDDLNPFDEVLGDLKEKWDSVENKSTVIVYGAGAVAALWISSAIIGAINSVPLLPKVMELVGLSYALWFTKRYLLFK